MLLEQMNFKNFQDDLKIRDITFVIQSSNGQTKQITLDSFQKLTNPLLKKPIGQNVELKPVELNKQTMDELKQMEQNFLKKK